VSISLKHTDHVINLTIEDDGVGFDTRKSTSGLGLKNIKHRLEIFNGRMKMISSPDNGCKLEAMFELNRAN
jgi:signal transduction histidine kinase